MTIYIQPYGVSDGANALAEGLRGIGLGCLKLKVSGSAYKGKEGDVVVNWGSTGTREYHGKVPVLNHPTSVALASNKARFFQEMEAASVPIPRWTKDYLQAIEWIHKDGLTIAAREILNGHSGEGLVISNNESFLPKAPLYTQFQKSKGEYRIHVFNGTMIDYSKKRRKTGEPPVGIEKSVRSHKNGWIFARKNLDGSAIEFPSSDFIDAAIKAVDVLGLNFGAVDVLNVDGKPLVLEVNTAPGLTGETTLQAYVGAIKNLFS